MFKINKKKNKHSSFWLPDVDYDSEILQELHEGDESHVEAMRLASYRRAIANFVKIVTQRDIPVYYKVGNDSLTDSNVVIISANIHDESLDSTVGLALHEGSHIILTDFTVIENLKLYIPTEVFKKAEALKIDADDTAYLVKSLLNWIEDRRIDYFMHSTAPGYRGYYFALYDRYFHSPEITEKLTSEKYRTEDIDSYFFRLYNVINPHSELDALKGLRKISEMINIGDIRRLGTTHDSFSLAMDVFNIILDYVQEYIKPPAKDKKKCKTKGVGAGSGKCPSTGDVIDEIETEKSEEGEGDGTGGEGETEEEKSARNEELQNDKDFEKQKNFTNGNTEKTGISSELKKKMDSLQEAGSKWKQVIYEDGYSKYKINVIVMHKVTDSVFNSPSFPWKCNHPQYDDEVQNGIRLGTTLGKKLKVRNEEKMTIFTRKDKGHLERRLLAELGFDNDHIFQQTFVETYANAILHISIDVSGSMSGEKLGNTITVATAIAKAATMAGNLNVVISLRGTDRNCKEAIMAIMYDSRIDKFHKLVKQLPYLTTNGVTPEGLCYAAIADEVVQSSRDVRSYFLNLCDGAPYFDNYSGMPAAIHTRKEIDKMREKGVGIMAYFFGYGGQENEQFKTMFGRDGKFINTSNAIEIARTLNDLFLSDEQKQVTTA